MTSFETTSTIDDVAPHLPLVPLPEHLAPLLSSTSTTMSADERKRVFTTTFLRAASAGNADTLEWLLSVPRERSSPSSSSSSSTAATASATPTNRRFSTGSSSTLSLASQIDAYLSDHVPRRWVDIEARDEEGNTALVLAVALGHADCVRVLIEAGADVQGTDAAGWTPLHWATQNNDVPIAAYLINHKASPEAMSRNRLSPKDLVKRGRQGVAMRDILRSAIEAAAAANADQSSLSEDGDKRPLSRASTMSTSSNPPAWASIPEKADEERRRRDMLRRLELARETVRSLDVDLDLLSLTTRSKRRGHEVGDEEERDGEGKEDDDDDDDDDDDEELEVTAREGDFVWETCLPHQMLVFSVDDLPVLFDVLVTQAKPSRSRTARLTPASAIFLCARYAHYYATHDLLDELFFTTIERIEAILHHRSSDIATCAFWLSNCLLLLYFVKNEPNLSAAASAHLQHLSELATEIVVFITRDAERRIDPVLEHTFLEHDPMPPGFSDSVQFQGEWLNTTRLVNKLTARARRTRSSIISANDVFGNTTSTANSSSATPPSTPPPATSTTSSPASSLRSSPIKLPNSHPNGTVSASAPETAKVSSILSSTLFVLQLYEIPPSIIVQVFSQLFYWLSCEIFNRLLSNKKYLCRSKAIQVRLNVTTIEEWTRQNRLPTKIPSVHFAPLNQLLQWLQCLSSESSIDGLIGTVQSFSSLNPVQLRKCVKDYRYEVDEPKIAHECEQYLSQIERQWLDRSPPPTRAPAPNLVQAQAHAARILDATFVNPTPASLAMYSPPVAELVKGELLNSRYMLPFALPTLTQLLVHNVDRTTITSRDLFGPFAADSGPSSSSSAVTTPNSTISSAKHRLSSHPTLSSVFEGGRNSTPAKNMPRSMSTSNVALLSLSTSPPPLHSLRPTTPSATIMTHSRSRSQPQFESLSGYDDDDDDNDDDDNDDGAGDSGHDGQDKARIVVPYLPDHFFAELDTAREAKASRDRERERERQRATRSRTTTSGSTRSAKSAVAANGLFGGDDEGEGVDEGVGVGVGGRPCAASASTALLFSNEIPITKSQDDDDDDGNPVPANNHSAADLLNTPQMSYSAHQAFSPSSFNPPPQPHHDMLFKQEVEDEDESLLETPRPPSGFAR